MRMLVLLAISLVAGCAQLDPNAKPTYGKESGLPANCRAFVQYAIDEYRLGKYTAEETMGALERNCGENGRAWAH